MIRPFALLLAGVCSAGIALAAPPAPTPPSPPAQAGLPDIPFTRFVLPNGLTVIVHEDHKAPVVSVQVWYHIGSGDEPEGRTGFAHLFEHLMFSGSENQKGSYITHFEQVGVTDMNGTTDFDRTNYYQTVPTSALDMALWMESDRMGHFLGAITQNELDTQRGVVQNEKRQSENAPGGRVLRDVLLHLFPANHPYQHDIIGSMEDLDAASLDDVKRWFAANYGTANATLVLAGDITVAQARAKAEEYFGDIAPGKPVPRQQPWSTPLAKQVRGVQHDQVAQTQIYRNWVGPDRRSPDKSALELAVRILGSGTTSRLEQRLLFRDGTVDAVSADYSPMALGGLLQIVADVSEDEDPAKVEAAIDQELARFIAQGPTEDELARAKMNLRSAFVRELENVSTKATHLAEGQLFRGAPDAFRLDLQRIEAATPADVRQAAATWFGRGDYLLTVLPAEEDFDAVAEDSRVVPLPAAPGRPAPVLPPAVEFRPGKSRVDRSHGVPQVTEFPELSFPILQRGRLSNGIEIVLAERHGVPITQVKLLFDAGYAADQGGKLGTAAFTASLMNESTQSLDTLELARRSERLGAYTGVGCDLDTCEASLDSLNEQLQPSLALLADMVRHPAFAQDDFARRRDEWLANIAQEKTSAETLATRLMPPLLYGPQHAYGIPFSGSGTEAAIKALTPNDLRKFHKTWLRPDNVRILVTGDTTLARITPQLEAVFGDWQPPAGAVPKKNIAQVPLPSQPRVFLVNRSESLQSQLQTGLLVPSSRSPDNLAIRMADQAYGGAFGSRMNMNLREDKRWTYGATTMLTGARGQRPFIVDTAVQTDKTAESAAEIQKEAQAVLGDKPLSTEEVEKAKNQFARSLPSAYQTSAAVMGALESIVTYGWPDDYVQTLPARLQAVDQAAAQKAIREIVAPQATTWLIIGDLKQIEAPVRALNLGEVQVLDANGRPVGKRR